MHKPTIQLLCIGAVSWIAALPVPSAAQTTPPPKTAATAGAQRLSAQQLDTVVAPIALYPDDLLAILLPAATTSVEIVKAQRFLEKRKSDPKLQPDASMPAPVKSLLNYPDVVKKMNDDLDWTTSLGTAVTAQQKDVIDAIQRFRRKVYSAGNLKTDDKQVVVVEKETIKVVQADPQVIYVPQYQPAQVVVVQSAPVYAYYPTPYPVYYYPYPPGAAFATGLIVGAATANAFNWNNSTINYNVNVNELQQNRANYANAAREDRQAQSQANQSQRQGQSSQNQTQRQESISSTTGANQAQRQQAAADQQTQRQEGASERQQSAQAQQSQRPETAAERQQGAAAAQRPSAQSTAFSGMDSGAEASRSSARGAQSRSGGGGGGGGRGRR